MTAGAAPRKRAYHRSIGAPGRRWPRGGVEFSPPRLRLLRPLLLAVLAPLTLQSAGASPTGASTPALANRQTPTPVAAWADAGAHTSLAGFTSSGDALLVRSTPDFSSAALGRARCGTDGCGGFEPLRSPGLGNARGAAVLADGSLLLTSSEPTGDPRAPDGWNLFLAAPEGDGWERPRPLPFPVATPFAECCATPAPGGGFLFASDRAGTWDIYAARREEGGGYAVQRLAALSSEPALPGEPGYFGEWPSFADPGGRFLLASSIRPGGVGADDVYVACAAPGGGWLPLRNLGAPVNTPGFEDGARVSPDGRVLYWSTRPPREGTSRVMSLPLDPGGLCPDAAPPPSRTHP